MTFLNMHNRLNAASVTALLVVGLLTVGLIVGFTLTTGPIQPSEAYQATVTESNRQTWAVNLTDSGFIPQSIRVQVGDTVRWTNQTDAVHVVRGGLAQQLYLPLVMTGSGAASSSAADENTQIALPSDWKDFSATLEPGGRTQFTFNLPGTYLYFAATSPRFVGEVVVELAALPATATATPSETPTAMPTDTPTTTLTPTAPASPTPTATPTEEGPPLPPDPSTVAPSLDDTGLWGFNDATSFLYSGQNPIQTGVISGTIVSNRAAVLRGRTLRQDGSGLPGVTISILDHPEFGQTRSRADGTFDLAVNGGGWLTVNYTKTGYLMVQRDVEVPWQDFAWLSDVVLTTLDPNVNTITLGSDTPQVAVGSPVTDEDGTRTGLLFIPAHTTVELLLPGGVTQTLSTAHLRITEYTVGASGPNAMPGELPPTSGYTYAAELSLDEAITAGALEVHFNQPLINYVDNFLSFPVGTNVPAGYYNRQAGTWKGSLNGRVIKIVQINGNLGDLDTDGDGVADNDPSLGITIEERQQLAQRFTAGQTLWRVPIPHFSPWDLNWPWDFPDNATPPNQPPPNQGLPPDNNDHQCRSVVECQSQVLRESIPIAGTEFSLNYASDRVPGRKDNYRLDIQLSGSNVPSSLSKIRLEVYVAGKRYVQDYSPQPNLKVPFLWDGRDVFGILRTAPARITVRIGYGYRAVYRPGSQSARGFADAGNDVTAIRTRQEVFVWQTWSGFLGIWDARNAFTLAGWSLNAHHAYELANRRLALGTGERRTASGVNQTIIESMAGTGVAGLSGDDGPAKQARLNRPFDVAVAPDGSVIIADYNNSRIRKLGLDGNITTIAGGGPSTPTYGDGGPAINAVVPGPHGVDIGPDGSIYIAQFVNGALQSRVRVIRPDSTIHTFAGTGTPGFSGDGGPATQAQLNNPTDVAVAADGTVFIVDAGNERVRRVGPDGIISTVAGGGSCGNLTFCGDGILAKEARLLQPKRVIVAPDGSLFIADLARVHRVWPDGTINMIAGNGQTTFDGNGVQATATGVYGASGLALASNGSLYISTFYGGNQRIFAVNPEGLIYEIAGDGTCPNSSCYNGDLIPAARARLAPSGLDIGPDGNLYLADISNNLVRRIRSSLPGLSAGDQLIPAEDGSEIYEFDGAGRHRRTIHGLTGEDLYSFQYDSAGRLASITDGDGNTTTIVRDAAGNPTGIVGPYGQATQLALNEDGFLASVTNPAGETTYMGYTADGLLTSFASPLGHTSSFTYTAQGLLMRDQDTVGGELNLSRSTGTQGYTVDVATSLGRTNTYQVTTDGIGNETRVNTLPSGLKTTEVIGVNGTRQWQAADGTTTQVVLDPDPRWGMLAPFGRATTIGTPGGLTATIFSQRVVTLTQLGNLFSFTAQQETVTVNGRTYTSTYTAASRTFTETTPAGRQMVTKIDGQGRLVFEQSAGLEPNSYTYDAQGRLSTVTQGTGSDARTVSFTYNSDGEVAAVTDPLGRTVSFGYDLAGRVTAQVLPDGRIVGYSYDTDGNLKSLTPPGQPAHTFDYTPVGLQSGYTPPDVGIGPTGTGYTYNSDRQTTHVSRPDSKALDIMYDLAGRPLSLTYSRGTVGYTYDPSSGNLNGITAPGGANLGFTYNGSLLVNQTSTGPVAGSVGYTYDNSFRRTAVSVNGANPISYGYDNDSLLTSAGALVLSRSAQNGLLTGSTLGGVTDSYRYNSFGEPVSYTASFNGVPLLSYQYAYDKLGRIITRTETISGLTDVFVYGYDLAGRLATVHKNGGLYSTYTYDVNGNRLSYAGVNGTASGTYDAQDRMLQYGGAMYTYSANGEIQTMTVAGQTTNYVYDEFGNLVQVLLPDGTNVEYVIDGLNRRIGKKVNGALAQGFLYDGQLRIVAELDGTGNVVSRFIYATHINVPDYMVRGGATYRFLTDHLGSPRLVIDAATGVVAQELNFDEFGRVLNGTNPGLQPFGFAGGLVDTNTGVVRFGSRDYYAEVGRWTTKDPIGFASGDNSLYEYGRNDPVNYVDPAGNTCFHFWTNVKDRFITTNKFIPGLLAPTGAGFLTAGTVAKGLGTWTWGSGARWLYQGIRLGLPRAVLAGEAVGVVSSAALTTAANALILGLAWEAGVGIGSVIGAAIDWGIHAATQKSSTSCGCN